ncbi:unnamed protein product [Linum tenue]|uniref:Peptidase M41 domain-containing protein n=1 Tax=Linum tenue TaxID=586396 RepID=A0AAV0HIU5_9ROSI|nr:unnamed protein product [Linum tenue]
MTRDCGDLPPSAENCGDAGDRRRGAIGDAGDRRRGRGWRPTAKLTTTGDSRDWRRGCGAAGDESPRCWRRRLEKRDEEGRLLEKRADCCRLLEKRDEGGRLDRYKDGDPVWLGTLMTVLQFTIRPMRGNDHEHEMAVKVEKMYDLAYFKAKEMLQQNHRVLEKIVDELPEFEILTGKDLERIIEENDGIREKEPFSLLETYYTEPVSSSFLEVANGPGPILLGSSS